MDQRLYPVDGPTMASGGASGTSATESVGGVGSSSISRGGVSGTSTWNPGSGGQVSWGFGGGPSGPQCTPRDGACDTLFECCDDSLVCRSGRCKSCLKANDTCESTLDCCSGICNSKHRCQDDNCDVQGTPCEFGSNNENNCCSGQCLPNPSGTGNVCQPLDGCQPVGESCKSGASCCSAYCAFDGSIGHCRALSRCVREGDVCSPSSKEHGCCVYGMQPLYCAPTSNTLDTYRCALNAAYVGCRSQNENCTHAAECCNGAEQKLKCLYTDTDFSSRKCVECGAERYGCIKSSDCCSGLTCDPLGGTCVQATGTGGTSSVGTAETCIQVNQVCGTTATAGGSGSATTAPCCGSAICETATNGQAKCVLN